jgi:hypothetical protein
VLDDPRFRALLTEIARALHTVETAIKALLDAPRPQK